MFQCLGSLNGSMSRDWERAMSLQTSTEKVSGRAGIETELSSRQPWPSDVVEKLSVTLVDTPGR